MIQSASIRYAVQVVAVVEARANRSWRYGPTLPCRPVFHAILQTHLEGSNVGWIYEQIPNRAEKVKIVNGTA